MVHSERRRTSQLHVELDGRIAHRLGEGGQLGQPVEPLARLAQGREGVVASREQDPPVGRRRHDRQRLLDEPERLFGSVGVEGSPRSIDREARRTNRVAGRQGVLGEHRQAGWGRVATVKQQVDHRGVDLPATGHRELVRGELADLLVRERVVGRFALRLREQKARHDGGRKIVGEWVGTIACAHHRRSGLLGRCMVASRHVRRDLVTTQPRSDRPEISQAEAAAQDRRLTERGLRPRRESRGPAIDQRPHR